MECTQDVKVQIEKLKTLFKKESLAMFPYTKIEMKCHDMRKHVKD